MTPSATAAALSAARQGMWLTERALDCRTLYHLPVVITLTGPVDVAALLDACRAVLRGHPELGMTFHAGVDGLVAAAGPRPEVPDVRPPLPGASCAARRPGAVVDDVRADELTRWLARMAGAPFDLEAGPPARIAVARTAPDRYTVVFTAHHIVFDGTSKDVFITELAARYREVTGWNKTPPATPAPQATQGTKPYDGSGADDVEAAARPYASWRPADPVLPGAPRASVLPAPGRAHRVVLPPALHHQVAAASQAWGRSRFEIHLAVLAGLLARYGTSAPQISVYVATSARRLDPDAIGMYVNELPVALDPDPTRPLSALTAQVAEWVRRLNQLRDVPFSHLAGALSPRSALAAVSISYRVAGPEPDFGAIRAHVDLAVFAGTARNTLHVQIVERGDETVLVFQCPLDGPLAPRLGDVAGHYRTLLDGGTAPATAGMRLGDLPILTGTERCALLDLAHPDSTAADLDDYVDRVDGDSDVLGATVPALITGQAATRPAAVAVVADGTTLGYATLLEVAGRGAWRLRELGVMPGDLVAVTTERGPDLLPALLAIHLAGAAYVPVDPQYPAERVSFVLEDCGAVLTVVGNTPRTPGAGTGREVTAAELLAPHPLAPDQLAPHGEATAVPAPRVAPGDTAYVIYTSGSTGHPKGVRVCHGALANLLRGMARLLESGPESVWLAATSLSFDIAALELFLPLVTGGRCILAPDRAGKDGSNLLRLMREHAVSHAQATPAGWRVLMEAGLNDPALVAVSGGEALPAQFGRDLASRVKRLVNAYGPTEATVWATTSEVGQDQATVTIGRPLPGYRAYVLDERLGLMPAGVAGELYLGGVGLADGYLNRPALTAQAFVPDPYGAAPGGRLYRTGDRALLRLDGTLEYLGRIDHQVKVSGYRIEPGEVESALATHPAVAEALVSAVPDDPGGARLVAHVRRAEAGFDDARALREHAALTLPAYMVPVGYAFLDAWPLTPNGKIDRSALPPTGVSRAEPDLTPGTARSPEVDPILAVVLEVCGGLLGFEDIGPDEDFFDLGAHSLTAIQAGARLRERLGVDVPVDVFFDLPTPAQIAGYVAERVS